MGRCRTDVLGDGETLLFLHDSDVWCSHQNEETPLWNCLRKEPWVPAGCRSLFPPGQEFPQFFLLSPSLVSRLKVWHPAPLTDTQAYVGGPLAISCVTNLQPFGFLWIHTWEKLPRREWDRIFHLCGEPNYFSFNRLTLDFIHFKSKRILILLKVLSHEFPAAI